MSCSCCCCGTPSGGLLEGSRKKERLVTEEEEEEEEEESRRNMDISLLREQYRCTRDRQRTHTQVLLFRTVSEELSEAVSIIPVTQGLTSPWEPNRRSPPATTFDPVTYDPWHVHLGLHRRCCPGVTAQLAVSFPETTNTISSSRRSSSSSEAASCRQDVDSTSDSPGSSRAASPFSRTTEEDHFNTDKSRGDPGAGSSDRSRGDPDMMGPVRVSVSGSLDASERNPSSGSTQDPPDASFSGSQERSAAGALSGPDESCTPVAPVASVACSPSTSTTSLHADLKENWSVGGLTSNSILQSSSTSACRFTRQLSVGGVGSSGGGYQPFPHRKTPRISEAARRLGMYSSF